MASFNSIHMIKELYTIHDFKLASEAKSLIQSAKLYETDQYILTLLTAAEDKLFEYLTSDKLVVDLKN